MGISFGKYTLLKKIATGGMAEIYLAQFTSIEGFKKKLVIKKILPEFSSNNKFISMFIEEAKIAVNFNHRNIVQVFDFGKIDNEYYIAMEYIDGFDLSHLFAFYASNPDQINIKVILFILTEILKGLNYAHNKSENEYFQLVHRDISLNNVIVSKNGDVKLLDFGIAKTGNIINGDDLKGKLSYMAPEQIRREAIDARVDIYGTGILGWRLLTGQKPFDIKVYNTVTSVLGVTIPNTKEINNLIPEDLSKIIMKSISKNKEDRYSSAEQFYEALYEYANENKMLLNSFQFSNILKKYYQHLFKYSFIENIEENSKHEESFDEKTSPQKKQGQTIVTEITSKSRVDYLNGEKKIVNLVYCDFKDLFNIFESVQCENFDKIMEDFFKIVENIVYKYQCSILFIDNYGMAFVFGAPASKENDVIQSIQFAFDVQDAFYAYIKDFKLSINLAIGIYRGSIIVNYISSDMRIKMVPIELTLKKARFIAESRQTGIYIIGKLKQFVEEAYKIENDDDLFKITGKKEKHESTINKLFGVETVFTGREKEFTKLTELINSSIQDKIFNTVTLWGEAGVGKSRAVYEFLKYVKTKKVYIIKGRSLSYEAGTPYNIIIDSLKSFLDLKNSQNKRTFEKKILSFLPSNFEESKKAEFISLLGSFIGIDYSDDMYIKNLKNDSNLLKSLQLNTIKNFFKIISKTLPVIIIFEDIHWTSDIALNFIEELGSFLIDASGLLLLVTRESLLQRKPNFGIDFQNYTQIKLRRLSQKDSEFLIKNILHKIEKLPDYLIAEIYEKSSGIPLFIEEIVKVLLEQDVILFKDNNLIFDNEKYKSLTIPLSVESILQARLDVLSIEEKRFIQKASVVGRVFWTGILRHLTIQQNQEPENIKILLNNLEDKDLIFKKSYKDSTLQEEYIFKHALLRDVAYHSIVEREKQTYHHQIATFLEKTSFNQIQNIESIIAFHFEKAKDYPKSVNYYLKAGDVAYNLSWGTESITNYLKALEIFPNIENGSKETYINLLLNVSKAYRDIAQYRNCQKYLDFAKEYVLRNNHEESLFNIYFNYSDLYNITSNSTKALLYINIAKTFVKNDKDYFNLLLKEAWIYYRKNKFKKSLNNLNIVLTNAQKDPENYSFEINEAYKTTSVVYAEQGKYELAIEYSEKTIDYYIEQKNLYKTAIALNNLGEIYKDMGNNELARQYYKRALDLSKKSGNPYIKALLSNNIGSVEIQDSNYHQAIKLLNYSIEILDELNTDGFKYETMRLLAEAYYHIGNYEEFLIKIELAEKYSLKARNYLNLSMVYIIMGDYYNVVEKNNKESEFYYLKANELANSIGAYLAQQIVLKKMIDFYSTKNNEKKLFYQKKYDELIKNKVK